MKLINIGKSEMNGFILCLRNIIDRLQNKAKILECLTFPVYVVVKIVLMSPTWPFKLNALLFSVHS